MRMSVRVFDFFAGCGGTSSGFQSAGLELALGLDIDQDAAESFKRNHQGTPFIQEDIRLVSPEALEPYIKKRRKPLLFCGCAPCQPFSRQNKHRSSSDPRINLLGEFSRFVRYWKPEYVFVENVPGLQRVLSKGGPLRKFTRMLDELGYTYDCQVMPALWFGVPQKRERLMLLASAKGSLQLPVPTHGPQAGRKPYTTVRDWIGSLPKVRAGEVDPDDVEHRAAQLSKENLLRIRATLEGGGRETWPPKLLLKCHEDHKGHSDVYGRLAWDLPASGLTTRCISYSNGRFGHPEQDRALTVREAACLQTFPISYEFSGSLESKARQVGNAVPPLMAKSVGAAVLRHSLGH